MIELYGMASPNVVKITLVLEELEFPYDFHWVSVWRGDQIGPDFEHLNPNRKVPVIVDEDGPDGKPYTIFESGAILSYLAEKTGLLFLREGTVRHDVMQKDRLVSRGIDAPRACASITGEAGSRHL